MTLLDTLLSAAEANANSSETWASFRNESQVGSIQGAADQAKTFADAAQGLVHAAAAIVLNGLQDK